MAYWGSGSDENDFAFGAVGVYVSIIKERMFKDIDVVREKGHDEQSILSSLACLRSIGSRFPKNLSVHFGKKDFAKAKQAFDDWYSLASPRLPEKHRKAILANASAEFSLFESEIFHGRP